MGRNILWIQGFGAECSCAMNPVHCRCFFRLIHLLFYGPILVPWCWKGCWDLHLLDLKQHQFTFQNCCFLHCKIKRKELIRWSLMTFHYSLSKVMLYKENRCPDFVHSISLTEVTSQVLGSGLLLYGTPMLTEPAKFTCTDIVIFFQKLWAGLKKKGLNRKKVWGIRIMNNSPQYLASRKGQLRAKEKIGVALVSIIDKCTLEQT